MSCFTLFSAVPGTGVESRLTSGAEKFAPVPAELCVFVLFAVRDFLCSPRHKILCQ